MRPQIKPGPLRRALRTALKACGANDLGQAGSDAVARVRRLPGPAR